MSTEEDRKTRIRQEKRREYFAFLDWRVPELHALGYKGVLARRQADSEYPAYKEAQK